MGNLTDSVVGPASQMFSWAFFPSMISQVVLQALVRLHVIADPKTAQHKAILLSRIRALSIILYLAWTVYSTIANVNPTLYAHLRLENGVDATTEEIKHRFRALARKLHPDKVGSNSSEPQGSAADLFILLRHASDTLQDPLKRASTDKFGWAGEESLDSMHAVVMTGLWQVLMYHVVSQLLFIVFHWLGGQPYTWSKGFLALVGFAFEVKLVISPHNPKPGALAWILPFPANTFTTWTAVTILRASCLSASIAIRHLGVLFPKSMTELSGKEKTLQEQQALALIHSQAEALRQGGVQIESLTAHLAADEIKPLTQPGQQGPPTLDEAARKAALAAAGAAETSSASRTKKNELDWIHLVAQEMVLQSLKSDPTIVAIVQQQQQRQRQQQSKKNETSGRADGTDPQQHAEQTADVKVDQPPASQEAPTSEASAYSAEKPLPDSEVQTDMLHQEAKGTPPIALREEKAQAPRAAE